MADNLLTICQNVADAVHLDRPAAIITSNDDTARKLLIRAKHTILELGSRPNTHWTDLVRVKEFSIALTGTTTATSSGFLVDTGVDFTNLDVSVGDVVKNTTDTTQTTVTAVAATQLTVADDIFTISEGYQIFRKEHSLPSDYSHMVDQTHWDKTQYWSLRGPMTAAEWRFYKHSVLGNSLTLRQRWRILSNGDATSPANKLNIDPADNASDMIYEYVSKHLVLASDGTTKETFTADTDTPILNQYLIELGMIWRMLSAMGLPYAEELEEYELQVEEAIGRDGGGRVLDLSRTPNKALINMTNVPDTGIGQ